jgi:hypothetical protein
LRRIFFQLPSVSNGRINGRIVSYVTIDATPKMRKKTSKIVKKFMATYLILQANMNNIGEQKDKSG